MTNPTPRRIAGRVRFLRPFPNKQDHGPAARPSAQGGPPRQDSDAALVLARAIHAAGMAGLASFALDTFKPLHWMGGQALWVLQPFIAAFGTGPGRGRDAGAGLSGLSGDAVARLLERDGGLDELAFHLARLQREGEAGTGAQP